MKPEKRAPFKKSKFNRQLRFVYKIVLTISYYSSGLLPLQSFENSCCTSFEAYRNRTRLALCQIGSRTPSSVPGAYLTQVLPACVSRLIAQL